MKRIISIALATPMVLVLSAGAFAQSDSRDELLKKIEAKRAELAVLEKQMLAPAEQDLTEYAEFLKQPNTGIIRLLPRENFDDLWGQKKPSMTIRGGGAYYSFTEHSHDYNSGSPQIELQRSTLSVGFSGANYGMLTNLGDVPLEMISVEHPAVRPVAEYLAPNELSGARIEQERVSKGVLLGGVTYKNRVPVVVSSTYVLRAITYNASDTLVAFRVVRQDTDGSIIIAWKLIKKYQVPKLGQKTDSTIGD